MVLLIGEAANPLRVSELAEVVHWRMGFRKFFSWALIPVTIRAT